MWSNLGTRQTAPVALMVILAWEGGVRVEAVDIALARGAVLTPQFYKRI